MFLSGFCTAAYVGIFYLCLLGFVVDCVCDVLLLSKLSSLQKVLKLRN